MERSSNMTWNWSLWSFVSTFTPTLSNTYYFVYRKKLQSEMFKQNILKLSYCAFKMSLMSNLNRYIFPLEVSLLGNFMQCF